MIITIIIILVVPFRINDYLISVFGLLWIFPLLPWGVWAQSGDSQAWSSKKWPSSKGEAWRETGGPGGVHPSWNEGPGQRPDTGHTRPLPAPPLSSAGHGPPGSTQQPSLGTVLRDPPLPFPASLLPAHAFTSLPLALISPRALPPAQALCENLLQLPPKRSWPPGAWDPMPPLPMRDKSLQTQMQFQPESVLGGIWFQ